MSKGGGSSYQPAGQTTTTSTTEPWAEQKPYLTRGFSWADELYNRAGPEYYRGPTIATVNDYINKGIGDQARLGGQITNDAGYLQDVFNGLASADQMQLNPATNRLVNLGSTNPADWARDILRGQVDATPPPQLNQLTGLADTNAATANPAYGALTNIAQGQTGGTGSGASFLDQLMSGIPGGIPGSDTLSQISSGAINPLTGAGTNWQTGALGTNPLASGSYDWLRNMSSRPGTGASNTPGWDMVSRIASGDTAPLEGSGAKDLITRLLTGGNPTSSGNPAYDYLLQEAAGQTHPFQAAGAKDFIASLIGGPNTVNAEGNYGANALQNFAAGNEQNTYLDNLSRSVMSEVLPGIQSQFIKGGGLSSPQAAFASSRGATAALAPVLNQAYQQQQAAKLAAGTTLAEQYMQGRQLKTSAALGQEQNQLALEQNRLRAGEFLGTQGLEGQRLQAETALGQEGQQLAAQNARMAAESALGGQQEAFQQNKLAGAKTVMDAMLGAGGWQAEIAKSMTADQLAALGQRLGAAGTYGQQGLTGAQLQVTGAGTQLGNELERLKVQLSAGQGLGGNFLQGQQLRQEALNNAMTGAFGYNAQRTNAANLLQEGQTAGTKAMADALNAAGGLYNTGVTQRIQALALAPSTYQAMLAGPQATYAAGTTLQANDQKIIDDLVARWNYEQTLPYQKLSQYLGQISGNYGGQTATTNPYYLNQGANVASSILGGATLGTGLASTLGAGSTGTAGLGVLGALGGLFGI